MSRRELRSLGEKGLVGEVKGLGFRGRVHGGKGGDDIVMAVVPRRVRNRIDKQGIPDHRRPPVPLRRDRIPLVRPLRTPSHPPLNVPVCCFRVLSIIRDRLYPRLMAQPQPRAADALARARAGAANARTAAVPTVAPGTGRSGHACGSGVEILLDPQVRIVPFI